MKSYLLIGILVAFFALYNVNSLPIKEEETLTTSTTTSVTEATENVSVTENEETSNLEFVDDDDEEEEEENFQGNPLNPFMLPNYGQFTMYQPIYGLNKNDNDYEDDGDEDESEENSEVNFHNFRINMPSMPFPPNFRINPNIRIIPFVPFNPAHSNQFRMNGGFQIGFMPNYNNDNDDEENEDQ